MKSVLRLLIPILGQLVFTITLPITLTILAVFYVYKKLVILSAELLGKEFLEPVSSSSLIFVCDDLTTNPWSIITTTFTLNGIPSKQKIYSDLEQILELRRPEDAKALIYGKLKSYVVTWKGYFWWKVDKHFSVKNHVKFIQRDIETPQAIYKIAKELARKPFKPNRPLWEITIVTNNDPKDTSNNKCVLFFRFSHGLMDGLTMIKLLYRLDGQIKIPEDFPKIQIKSNPLLQNLFLIFQGIFRGIYEYLEVIMAEPDFNPIHLFSEKRPQTRDWLFSSVCPINLARFKKAKQILKCSFLDLILTGISGGMEKFMESKGSVPKQIRFLSPIPKVNHPDDYMDNHFYYTVMKLPLRISNLRDKINAIHECSHSGLPTPFSVIMDLLKEPLCILPVASFVKELTKLKGFTSLASLMTVGNRIPKIFGQEPRVLQYWLPIGGFDSSAMTFSVATSIDKIRISLLVDRGATTNSSDIDNLTSLIYNEFENIFQFANQLVRKND